MLPAFASIDDLEARMGSVVDAARAQTALEDASAEIRAYTRRSWATDGELALPTGTEAWKADVLVKVCCSIARRVLENPEGFSQESIGSFSHSAANASNDVYLTASERRDLQSVIGTGGLWTLATTRSVDDMPDVIDCVNAQSGAESTMPFTYEPLS